MYNYEPVKEFEKLNEALGSIFKGISNILGKSQTKSPSAEELIKKYEKEAETNDECKVFGPGSKQNNLFFSEIGSASAIIGKNGNKIKDISGLNISKSYLRCYDLKKDKKNIGFLFADDAIFNADRIWSDKNGEIYFSGVWEQGEFKGTFVSPIENFKGGTFSGKILDGPNQNIPNVTKPPIVKKKNNLSGALKENLSLVSYIKRNII